MSKVDELVPVFVVLETFGTDIDGVPTTYHKGETIDARHPSVKRWPTRFGPLSLSHPVPASVLSFAKKMADARAASKAAKEAAAAEDAAKQAAEEAEAQAALEAKAALEAVPVQDALATPEVRAE